MSRLVVLGADGMLGHKLCQRLAAGGEREVIGTLRGDPQVATAAWPEVFSRVRLIGGVDVLRGDELERKLAELAPQAVINAIGIVKQAAGAQNRYLSAAVNAWLPHRLAQWCGANDSRLVHFSTDCVFDGMRGRYTEQDPSDARDLYGQSKYLGETDAMESAAITIRSSIIGRELRDPKHGLIEWFLAQRGGRARGFARAIYSGFTTIEMARIVERIIDRHPSLAGTHHIASEMVSKYDLLSLINRRFGLGITIERDEEFFCDRSLLMGSFAEATNYSPPSWDAMIQELVEDPTPYDRYAGAARR